MKPSHKLSLASLLVALALTGCKPNPPATPAPASPRASDTAAPTAPAQSYNTSVSGTISFAGKPPAPVDIDTSMDPVCSLAGGKVASEQYVVKSGKLANVFLYLKSGAPAAMNAARPVTQPVVLDQKGCQYIPHVIAVMQGGSVEFRNSDSTMHNIHTMPTVVGNETIDVSQGPHGAPQVKQFTHAEVMMPVRCNNHPWMNAFINVSATPYFAVSDASGHFTISGLPPGDYVLAAVHEKLGEQTVPLHIAADSDAKADFTFAIK